MQNNESVIAVGMVEAARRLGLSVRTVAALVSSRELPRIIPVTALEAFVSGGPAVGPFKATVKSVAGG
jgi:hypothetical protein